MLTVKELKDKLEGFPENSPIIFRVKDGFFKLYAISQAFDAGPESDMDLTTLQLQKLKRTANPITEVSETNEGKTYEGLN